MLFSYREIYDNRLLHKVLGPIVYAKNTYTLF